MYLYQGYWGIKPNDPSIPPPPQPPVAGCNGACQCDPPFDPATNCATCLAGPGYDPATNCIDCSNGYSRDANDPNDTQCYPLCGIVATPTDLAEFPSFCHHADYYNGTTAKDGCFCSCKDFWTGPRCVECPFDSADNLCQACAPGYEGTPPNCVRVNCDASKLDCGPAGYEATGRLDSGCTCTICLNKWEGARCNVCPPNVSLSPNTLHPSLDCNFCLPDNVWRNPANSSAGCVWYP